MKHHPSNVCGTITPAWNRNAKHGMSHEKTASGGCISLTKTTYESQECEGCHENRRDVQPVNIPELSTCKDYLLCFDCRRKLIGIIEGNML